MFGNGMGRGGTFGFIIALLFAAYLIVVKSLALFTLPSFLTSADKWIVLVAGILLVLGGYYFRKDKRY